MITHLRGTLTHKSPTRAVIDVGGVGYGLAISLATYERLPQAGAETETLTHTYVREDRLELFGFADEVEREMFGLLIGVSGIGPTSAQMILSGLSVADLQQAIHGERVTELTQVKGVGPKTARRIVLELKDRIRPIPGDGDDRQPGAGAAADPVAEEAVLALEALGYAAAAARKAVTAARKAAGDGVSVQSLIKSALRQR